MAGKPSRGQWTSGHLNKTSPIYGDSLAGSYNALFYLNGLTVVQHFHSFQIKSDGNTISVSDSDERQQFSSQQGVLLPLLHALPCCPSHLYEAISAQQGSTPFITRIVSHNILNPHKVTLVCSYVADYPAMSFYHFCMLTNRNPKINKLRWAINL